MINYKNRKIITTIVIAFTLNLIIIGSAYALALEHLDIENQIGMSYPNLSVIWTDGGTTTQSDSDIASTNVSRRISGVGGDCNVLEWSISFIEGRSGTVTLTATVTNSGTIPAILGVPTLDWGISGSNGLDYIMNSTAFIGPLGAGETSENLVVTIEMPSGWVNPLKADVSHFNSTTDGCTNNLLADDVYDFLTSFTIRLVYEAGLP
jgi:hypothetical protein